MLLDVGSGNHPHPRANVTCDLYFNAEFERGPGGPVNIVENFVICDAQHLPFRSQIFAESNCTHVLEHLDDPRIGFHELKRVSKRGYVETPGLIYEQVLFGFSFHDWTFTKRNGKLYFTKPRKLKIFGRTVLPIGWFTHPLALLFLRKNSNHKELNPLLQPLRRLLLFNVQYWWS